MASALKRLVVGSIPGVGKGRKKFFFFICFDFVVLGTFGEILVLGLIPGVGKVKLFSFFFHLEVLESVHR